MDIQYWILLASFMSFLIGYLLLKKNQSFFKAIIDDPNFNHDETKEYSTRNVPIKKDGWLPIQNKAENCVVQIFSVSSIFNWLQPFKPPAQVTVAGSGFFINDAGYFVTNAHVVEHAKSVWIEVPALGRKNINADIISICPERDLALLKIRKNGIKDIQEILQKIQFLPLGDSDLVHRTDDILALGYPLGQHYLKSTTGIVSGREHIDEQLFIQIDAAINPGSSGGPVLNENGEVIGISNVMVPAAQSVGYIIPINELKTILNDLFTFPFLRKTSLGIGFHSTNNDQAIFLKNPLPGGLYVNKVFKDSIAQKAGIQKGDMIYEINDCKLDVFGEAKVSWSSDKVSILDIISRFSNGQNVRIVLYRNGDKKEINFKFENSPIYPIRLIYPEYEKVDYEIIGGIVFMELTENHVHNLFSIAPELIKFEYTENQTESKLIISYIFPGSEAFRLRTFNPGNIITHINDIQVNNLNQLRNALDQSLNTGFITIRTENNIFLVLNLLQALQDEIRLSQDFKYFLTPMTKHLISVIDAAQKQMAQKNQTN